MKFAKGAEQNFSTEIFRISKVIERRPRPLYELKDLNDTPIDGQFYQEELTPVRVTRRTVYKIDKILDKRIRRGSLEYLVRWRGYSKDRFLDLRVWRERCAMIRTTFTSRCSATPRRIYIQVTRSPDSRQSCHGR